MELIDEGDEFMEKQFFSKDNVYPEDTPGFGLEENQNFMLCLKNVPNYMDNISLETILNNFGEVVAVTGSDDPYSDLRFAQCKDMCSLEAIIRGMGENEWHIEVFQKIEKKVPDDADEVILPAVKPVPIEDTSLIHPNISHLKCLQYSNKSTNSMYFISNRLNNFIGYFGEDFDDVEITGDFQKISESGFHKKANTIFPFEFGSCGCCGINAMDKCGRCSQFYCSRECQKKDWPVHKFRCGIKKGPVDPNKSKVEKRDPCFGLREHASLKIPESGLKVLVTHIEKSNLIFVRPIHNPNDQPHYLRIINIIATHGIYAKELSSLPKVNSFVFAQYKTLWFRGLVLDSLSENEILIAYVDVGFTELKSRKELREYPIELRDFKIMPFCINLKHVNDVVLNSKVKTYLWNLVEENEGFMITHEKTDVKDGVPVVEMMSCKTNQNINKKINILINPIEPEMYGDVVTIEQQDLIQFKPGVNVKMVILDNSFINIGQISCILLEDIQELEKINQMINAYTTKSLQSKYYTPREGEICLVKTCKDPEMWYRAICEIVAGNGRPFVQLLDYGNVCEISIENIRKCPKQLQLPYFTNTCYIKDIQDYTKTHKLESEGEIVKRLQGLLENYSVITVPAVQLIEEKVYLNIPIKIDD